MEFSIPLQAPYKHFANLGVLKMSAFTKQYIYI